LAFTPFTPSLPSERLRAIAYWVSRNLLKSLEKSIYLKNLGIASEGIKTGNNNRFLRLWFEVDDTKFTFNKKRRLFKWYPHHKGGDFRRWYGNNDYVINWENNGYEIKQEDNSGIQGKEILFKGCISWGKITSSSFSIRWIDEGHSFDSGSPAFFTFDNERILEILAILSSKIGEYFFKLINPTINLQVGNIYNFPFISHPNLEYVIFSTKKCIDISRQDWDNFETSWDFQTHPLLRHNTKHLTETFTNWQNQAEIAFRQLQHLEEENNRYWIEAYELQDELTPEVPDDQITIRRADLNKDIRSLISYAVGCILGRYSLDKPGLIHAGQPFDPSLHRTFPASNDAIIPITDQAYFDQDIITRFLEFLRIAYSPDTLTENLNFIANALTLKNGESPQERIRRYFLQEFISDHIQTYKKRPIYWLFTSGKKTRL